MLYGGEIKLNYIAKLKLSNIKCGGCFSQISQIIYQENIIHLDMDHVNKIATITFDTDDSVIKRIIKRINVTKYEAELIYIEEE